MQDSMMGQASMLLGLQHAPSHLHHIEASANIGTVIPGSSFTLKLSVLHKHVDIVTKQRVRTSYYQHC